MFQYHNFTLPLGTGKTVTGVHIAYALAMKLREDRPVTLLERFEEQEEEDMLDENGPRWPCVMYCGPTQQSVNVALGMLAPYVLFV